MAAEAQARLLLRLRREVDGERPERPPELPPGTRSLVVRGLRLLHDYDGVIVSQNDRMLLFVLSAIAAGICVVKSIFALVSKR